MEINLYYLISYIVAFIFIFALGILIGGNLLILILPSIRRLKNYQKYLSKFLICKEMVTGYEGKTAVQFVKYIGIVENLNHSEDINKEQITQYKLLQNGKFFEIVNYPLSRLRKLVTKLQRLAFIILLGSIFATLYHINSEDFVLSWEFFVSLTRYGVFQLIAITDFVSFVLILNQFQTEINHIRELTEIKA